MNLRSIHTLKQLVRNLVGELDWPLKGHEIEDLTFAHCHQEEGDMPSLSARETFANPGFRDGFESKQTREGHVVPPDT